MTPQVSALPISYDNYLRHGWKLVAINPGSKGPKSPNWNRQENCITDSKQVPPGYGVGLAHAYSGTCAIDIDDWDTASNYLKQINIDLQQLFNAPDAVTIESGNAGHGKLLYAMPFGLTLTSKKLIATRADSTKYNFLDFRCATTNGLTVQDVLPPTVHPTTMRPYQWGGKGDWSALPVIPYELLMLWQQLLQQDQQKTLKTDSKHNASWDDVKSALTTIDPDCDRDQWVNIAMALHHAGSQDNQHDTAYQIFDEWSAQGRKYQGPLDINNVWRSLKTDGGITLGTLFHIAQENGWKRPLPDVQHLFKRNPLEPSSVIDLVSLRIQPPEIPMSLFPPVLARRANEVSVSVGCDPIIPLMAGLAAVSGVADKRMRLELMPGYQVPPILWVMTIGDPSDKKSPGARPMFRVINDLEISDSDRYKAEMLIWKGKEAAHAAGTKAYMDHCASATAQLGNEAAPVIPPLPDEPKSLRILINDTTSQKLVHLSQGRPRGFLLELDEMSHWIQRANDPRSGDDRGSWIAGYESRRYRMDRISAGEISTENLALAIYGNIQPQVFSNSVAKMSTDGLLQRFIPASVRGDKTRINNPIPDYLTNTEDYELTLRRIFALQPKTYHLDSSAYKVFRDFQEWYNDLRGDERTIGSNSIYMTALGKIEGTTGRLALIFHLMDNPTSDHVSAETMQRATDVAKAFIVPSLRYSFANEDSHLAEWIQDYIIHHSSELQSITLSAIRRSARRQIPDSWPAHIVDREIRITMDQLVEAGWLALLEDNRLTTEWAINAELANLYPDHRKRIIKARQRLNEKIRDSVKERFGTDSKRPEYVRGYNPEWDNE